MRRSDRRSAGSCRAAFAGRDVHPGLDAAAAESITEFCFDHDLEAIAFEYTPNVDADTLSGMLTVEVPGETYGGDVNTRITSDFEWQISGDITFTAAAAAMASSSSSQE